MNHETFQHFEPNEMHHRRVLSRLDTTSATFSGSSFRTRFYFNLFFPSDTLHRVDLFVYLVFRTFIHSN